MNENFYLNLESINNLNDILDNKKYKAIPTTWSIVITDVKNSTEAIKEGKYKNINFVGAISIIAILNINKLLDLPFVFGGDGSFILIPNSLLFDTKQALVHIQKLAKEKYFLDLRVGIIPINDIYLQNKKVQITKLKLKDESSQAIIKGGGLELSEELLKNSQKYIIDEKPDEKFNLDLEGLECRWKQINSPKDKTLSIILKCENDLYYKEVLDSFERIIGDKNSRSPLSLDNLKLSFDNNDLDTEALLYCKNKKEKFINILKFKFINILGYFLIRFKIGQWANYKNRISSTIDSEKFDDLLRMVVSTTNKQTKELKDYLQEEYKKGKLVYGVHESKSALMTCLIFQRHGKHIHFIDSSDGGYSLAAYAYKKRKNK
ncbi:MAG: DUF3095 family protein [Poseidonibacter sp.]|uniref:DUF3095 family protein n=1 Tax=Poseidonibacter sp. TaxID=2321188 RepID=UPI00359CF297